MKPGDTKTKDAPDPKDQKPPTEPPKPPKEQSSSDLVTVRVVRQAVGENNQTFAKGETFLTTPDRAAALGSLVERI